MDINIMNVGIIGAGTMGRGIAQLTAMAGFSTLLYDIEATVLAEALEKITENLEKGIAKGKLSEGQWKATLNNISTTSAITEVKADLIIEAVAEDLEVKLQVFHDLEKVNSDRTILASNTSSISITQMSAQLKHPTRFVGMHFFNPAHVMKLVEVISGAGTDPDVADSAKEFAEKLGKVAVMAKDYPGFIVNRVGRPFYVEGLKILEENVADVETIDSLLQATGFRMGPFQLMDLIGLDVNFKVTTGLYDAFHHEAKFRPSRIQQQKVDAGYFGRKSGKGFYEYDDNKSRT